MRNLPYLLRLAIVAIFAGSCVLSVGAQTASSVVAYADDTLPDDPSVSKTASNTAVPPSTANGQQTKRILGIVPNFRAVSVDAKLPPLSPETSSN